MIKKTILILVAGLIIIQFFRPEKNDSNEETYGIATQYTVPDEINEILSTACNDCHSNNTVYPWYSNIQPIAWWLEEHIEDGKRHLNFSTFTQLPLARQFHKFEEIVEEVREEEMPLKDYTYLGMHQDAKLSPEQRNSLVQWANAQMTFMKNTYPADSLIRKKKK